MNTKTKKPIVKLTGTDGNVFSLMGIVNKELKRNGMESQSKEMTDKIFKCGSYSEALSIIGQYVTIK